MSDNGIGMEYCDRDWHENVAACSSRATVKRTGDEWPACDCGADDALVDETCRIVGAILDGDPGPHLFGNERLTALAARITALLASHAATPSQIAARSQREYLG